MVRALASHQRGLGSTPGPGVICGLSLLFVLVLAPRGLIRVLRFSPLPKNQHFHIPIRSGAHGHVLTTFRARKCFVGKQSTLTFFLGTFTIVLICNMRR